MNPKAPIGIFDSGIGGLTVADAITRLMPEENIIYLGDTAHFPYGDKSVEAIQSYSIRISRFLFESGCKAIVIACNTASSTGYKAVRNSLPANIPLINVIDPVVEAVSRKKKNSKIGVIGTKATIKSGAYQNRIKKIKPETDVGSLATPLLAPMIEEGFFNNKISRTIINSYLCRPKLKNISSLILACTHYPLIKPEIEEYYSGEVEIFDSAFIVATYLRKLLARKKLLGSTRRNKHHFYVTDYTPYFEKSTKIFFRGKIKLEQLNLWEV